MTVIEFDQPTWLKIYPTYNGCSNRFYLGLLDTFQQDSNSDK